MVEKQLSKLIGLKKAEVNYVAGSATVVYDAMAIDLRAIKAMVHECGYHCAGELCRYISVCPKIFLPPQLRYAPHRVCP